MPSPRAYGEAQVIAMGIELEKTGPVTAKLLHEALGGRGDRYTAFGTWQAFTDQRQHLASIPAKNEAAGSSRIPWTGRSGRVEEVVRPNETVAARWP